MDEQAFKHRTRAVALRVIRLVDSLPKTRVADVIGRQLLRSATSIGANYRAACRGVSRADVISKLGDVEEEADETLYWLELLIDCLWSAPACRRFESAAEPPHSKIRNENERFHSSDTWRSEIAPPAN